jgi:hypothetical protein
MDKKHSRVKRETQHELEAKVRYEVRKFFGQIPQVRLFPNPVGTGWVGPVVRSDSEHVVLKNARQISFGLAPGSSDNIGWVELNGIAVPLLPEFKSPTGKPSEQQQAFISMAKGMGCIAGVVRSVDDLLDLIDEFITEKKIFRPTWFMQYRSGLK